MPAVSAHPERAPVHVMPFGDHSMQQALNQDFFELWDLVMLADHMLYVLTQCHQLIKVVATTFLAATFGDSDSSVPCPHLSIKAIGHECHASIQ